MSTFIHLMPQTLDADAAEVLTVEAQPQETTPARAVARDLESFAEEQIRGLVRRVYLAGSKPCRQVVFSAVDRKTSVSPLCSRIAETLSEEASGTTCLLDAGLQGRSTAAQNSRFGTSSDEKRFGRLRDSSLQLSSRLWYMSTEVFRGEQESGMSSAWLKSRLAELRLEFDYLVIQAPATGATNEAALFARLCDGLVLIVEANSTRRATAQKVRDVLSAAHVRLLGTVLSERTFPIPSAIYKRV
jgi:hypothetical protein